MNNIQTTIESNIVVNTVTGLVTAEMIFNYIQANIDNWIGKPVLWETSKADLTNITTRDWISILYKGKNLSAKRSGQKTALVGSGDFIFGMVRMFAISADALNMPIKFHSFRDINQAKEWLTEKM